METGQTHCIRCGECCLKSSPTMQMEDLAIVKHGLVKGSSLYTIRKGELVRDNVNGGLMITPHEVIKIKEKDGEHRGCIFYDEAGKACMIYEQRPAQCAALKCWDPEDFMRLHRSQKPTRKDIIEDRILLGLIEEHERRCSYQALEGRVREIESEGDKAVDKILDLLKFDFHLRPLISERLDLDPAEMDFVFGRPLLQTVTMFGLQVIREPDGSLFLTTSK